MDSLSNASLTVESKLPLKKEYVVYASITELQKAYYEAVLGNRLHEFLDQRISGSNIRSLKAETNDDVSSVDDYGRTTTKTSESQLTSVPLEAHSITCDDPLPIQGGRDLRPSGLQNLIMQLRKVCNHPYLFDYPVDSEGNFIVSEELVKSSGKMMLLDRLLPALIAQGHKVLLFSQMTRMLDLIQDYLQLRNFQFCRIDGSISYADRIRQLDEFEKDPSVKIFLLSTRAGGLGLNLTAADTVILFDSDWVCNS
jgi:ATP-dependent DNA helicase